MANTPTPEEQEKQAAAEKAALEKAAAVSHQVIAREVFLPVFAKVAGKYDAPVPANDADLARVLDMADYLVAKKRAAAQSAPNPIEAMYEELSKEAGVAAPAGFHAQPMQIAQAVITNDVVGELAKQAIAALAQSA